MLKNYFLIALMAAGMLACETTDITPIAAGARPQDQASDEAGLWQVMDKSEEYLKTAAVLVHDKKLNTYVSDVTCRVTGPDYCRDLRVYVIEAPYFNASMAPNGLVQVWTGLLLRAQNEAQLAFVLGHEFIHYQERHSVEQFRKYKNAANANLILGVGAGVAGVPEAAYVGSAILTVRFFGFGRDKEREADIKGFAAAVDAGYDPSQGAALWGSIIDEVDASSSKRKKKRYARASIYSTHPLNTERVANLTALAEKLPEGYLGTEEHRAAIAPFLDEWLDADLTRRDFGEHIFLIERLLKGNRDQGVLYYRLGEAYRVRRDDGDLAKAKEAYQTAAKYLDTPPSNWRSLGDILRRDNDLGAANDAYNAYLQKHPDAPDRALIERYLSPRAAEETSNEAS